MNWMLLSAVIGYINWAVGTSGNVPTATVLSNCVVGTAGTWTISGNITFTNFAQKNLGGTVSIGGTTFDGSESLVGLSLLANQANDDAIKLLFTPTNWGSAINGPNTAITKCSIGGWMKTDLVPLASGSGGQQHDFAFIKAVGANLAGSSDFINAFFNTINDRSPCAGTIWNGIEAGGFAPINPLSCSATGEWEWYTEYFEKGMVNRIAYYTNGTSFFLKSQTNWVQTDNLSYPFAVEFHFHQTTAADAGKHAYYGPVILTDGDWPVLPSGFVSNIIASFGPCTLGKMSTQ